MSLQTLLAAGLLALSIGAPEDNVLPFSPEVVQLDNGLRLVMVKHPSPGLVAYFTLVRVGSRDESEKGVTGFAHFFEHMMFRGTDTYPPDKVQAFLKKTGADQNGFTTDDFTCYTFFGSSAHLEELVKIEADRFQNLKYSVDAFKTESLAVLGEYNKSSSNPSLPIRERLREKVFTKHTYGHTTLGYLADIEDMPNQFEYSRTFFDRFYTPDNSTLIVVGDFDPASLQKWVNQYYGGWKKKRTKSAIVAEPRQKTEVREHIDWPTPTLPTLSMSWRTPATDYTSKETAVYNIIGELLWGKISAVYRELVLDEQKVISFSDWSFNHRDPYLLHVYVRLKDAAAFEAVEQRVQRAADDLAAGRLDPKLLEDVKANVRYSSVLELNTPSQIALYLGYYMGPTGDPNGLEQMLRTIDAVSVDDVRRFAKKYLGTKSRSIVTLAQKRADASAKAGK